MKNEPLVSIITPLYNCEKYIGETIESVINQTFQNWEMIIIDDCSTDKSFETAKEYGKKEQRIKIIHLQKNTGAACSRNVGIAKANGEYIAFLDSDDIWHPNKLEVQIKFMQTNDAEITYTSYQRITKNGEKGKIITPSEKVNYQKMLFQNYIGLSTAVINVKKNGKYFFTPHIRREDYAYWLVLLRDNIKDAYLCNEIFTFYRIRKNSLSSKKYKLIKYQFFLYHNVLGLNFFQSLFFTLYNIFIKITRLK